jgi:cobalt/nickel transport system ATP-binding protein
LENIIEISNLYYDYPDGTAALKGIDLNIRRGERAALIGANGAGKSTLLLHLNGLITSRKGSIRICGKEICRENIREVRKMVGLVFQNPDDQLFCPNLYEDCAFGPRNMVFPEEEIHRRVREAVDSVGLSGLEKKGAFHFSLGQKKRAALATALSMKPEILAVDEPTSHLDPKGRREVRELLKRIGGTQVIVTHDLEYLPDMADRAIVMKDGKILREGSAEEIAAQRGLLDEAGLI